MVDFCGYKWRDLQSSFKAVEAVALKYIFISSDSVYNNFVNGSKQPITEEQFDLEEEYHQIKVKERKSLDKYGYVLLNRPRTR